MNSSWSPSSWVTRTRCPRPAGASYAARHMSRTRRPKSSPALGAAAALVHGGHAALRRGFVIPQLLRRPFSRASLVPRRFACGAPSGSLPGRCLADAASVSSWPLRRLRLDGLPDRPRRLACAVLIASRWHTFSTCDPAPTRSQGGLRAAIAVALRRSALQRRLLRLRALPRLIWHCCRSPCGWAASGSSKSCALVLRGGWACMPQQLWAVDLPRWCLRSLPRPCSRPLRLG